jgi:hypothetical protein
MVVVAAAIISAKRIVGVLRLEHRDRFLVVRWKSWQLFFVASHLLERGDCIFE